MQYAHDYASTEVSWRPSTPRNVSEKGVDLRPRHKIIEMSALDAKIYYEVVLKI